MIRRLFDQVVDAISASADNDGSDTGRDAALRMATAVLMIDVARADHVFDEAEFDRVLRLIESHFELAPDDAAELFNAASEQADDLVSAHEFTKVLHEHLDENEKAKVISLLWEIAYADGELDKYENSLVLKISDLLYVSRGRVMRLKHDAANGAE